MPHFMNPSSEGQPERTPGNLAQAQFRESSRIQNKADSYEARSERVRQACSKKFSDANNGSGPYLNEAGTSSYAYVEKTFKDSVVFRKGDKLYKATYAEEDGEISFGDPVEVDDSYVERKVTEANRKKKKKGKGGYSKEPVAKGWTGTIGKPYVP